MNLINTKMHKHLETEQLFFVEYLATFEKKIRKQCFLELTLEKNWLQAKST